MEKEDAETSPGSSSLWLLKSIFAKRINGDGDAKTSPTKNIDLPFLSLHAESVVSRCSEILDISPKELRSQFDEDLPDEVRQPPVYARNFIEFCSYKAIHLTMTRPSYLNDKKFRRLTFDMMIAWEAPSFENDLVDTETTSCSSQDVEGEDGWSLFYSNSTKMAVQVDDKNSVGLEAFTRIAPSCPLIADITTVHNLFYVLTSSTGPRLHFLVYEKYLRSLEKVTKFAQNAAGPQVISSLPLAEDEIILDTDGTAPTQPVLQHVGMSAWPGRLTLTNYALYFEPGVGLYDKAMRYDLATEMKQVIKPELTGPLGARLFDKAVMYKSTSIAEPIYLEFPEFRGCSRRDYWLDICLEILRAHRFIRKYNLKGNQQHEALARAILGIFRFRAVKEAFQISSSCYRTMLCFNLAESLPGGDMIMAALSNCLKLISNNTEQRDVLSSPSARRHPAFPTALTILIRLKIVSSKEDLDDGATYKGGDVCVGELNPLEAVVKQLKEDTGIAEAAQASVNQVKVEGIDSNLAVMKELLFPVVELCCRLHGLASWNDPYKSVMFLVIFSYVILRDWIKYMLPAILIFLAVIMLARRYTVKRNQIEAFKVVAPPSKNAVEQLLALQESISHLESFIQGCNIVLLKVRALLFSVAPQVTENVALLLVLVALALAFLPLKFLLLLVFVESFTRDMPLRKESSERGMRRLKEWWNKIPAAPVQLMKPDDKKRK